MAYDYDKLYGTTPDALGEPTQIFVDFFKRQKRTQLRVLDVGCGQGRDALFIARQGHRVVGVDISPHGIQDLVEAANQEKLHIEGIVADIVTFAPEGKFDVVLIDRTLHMLSEIERLNVFEYLIGHVAEGGWVLIADERSNISGLKDVIEANKAVWETAFEARGNIFFHRS